MNKIGKREKGYLLFKGLRMYYDRFMIPVSFIKRSYRLENLTDKTTLYR